MVYHKNDLKQKHSHLGDEIMPKIFSEEDCIIIKKKLLEIGLEKLKGKRYKMISLEEVTAQAGIAKGTFYRFFDSKEAYFYEIMHWIKENNRKKLQELFLDGCPARQSVEQYLVQRYCEEQTVYDYFTPEEIRRIIRKLPDGDTANDSLEFAQTLLSHAENEKQVKSEVVVNMLNVLGMAATNKEMLCSEEYKTTISLLVKTLTDYIFGQ